MARKHLTADVEEGPEVSDETAVRQHAHLRAGARGGGVRESTIDRGVHFSLGVRIGHQCKTEEYTLVHEPAVVDDAVFVGHTSVFTNDLNPSAATPDDILRKHAAHPRSVLTRPQKRTAK